VKDLLLFGMLGQVSERIGHSLCLLDPGLSGLDGVEQLFPTAQTQGCAVPAGEVSDGIGRIAAQARG